MTMRMALPLSLAAVAVFACVALPLSVRADTVPSGDLRAAIMTELLRDPRTAQIPPEQLAALVDALTVEAQAQSVTAADILWHPESFYKAAAAAQAQAQYFAQCDSAYALFCPFNQAFGFAGTDSNLPGWLLVLSGVLTLLIPRMRKHHEDEEQPATA